MKSKDFSTPHNFPIVTSRPQLAIGKPQCINLPFPKFKAPSDQIWDLIKMTPIWAS